MDFIGLHITKRNIYAVELAAAKRGRKRLVNFIKAPSPPYSLESEVELDLDSFAKELGSILREGDFSTKNVFVALPESQVFTRVISMPKMSDKELKEAMKWEAGQYIPIPLDEVTFDYQVISDHREHNKLDVLLVAAPLTLTKKFLKIVKKAGLRMVGVETESVAVARSLVGSDSTAPTSAIVLIGDGATDIFIVDRGSIIFTRSITTGGDAMVRVVSQELGIEPERAAEYLKSYGLEESAFEGRVKAALKPVFDVVLSEIKRSLAYYVTHIKGNNIERLILAGAHAKVPGVLVFLASAVNLEVLLADPWDRVEVSGKFSQEELEDVAPEFAVAVGLALKEI
jgi:type IV pilus assembly protein PilM